VAYLFGPPSIIMGRNMLHCVTVYIHTVSQKNPDSDHEHKLPQLHDNTRRAADQWRQRLPENKTTSVTTRFKSASSSSEADTLNM